LILSKGGCSQKRGGDDGEESGDFVHRR
jgi:hypothetical protein